MHEAAHQLAFNAGLQKRGVMYPVWVSEGLATMFEAGAPESFDSIRCRRLDEMRKNKRLFRLEEFVAITRLPADAERQKDFYAQAWGLFRFLSDYHNESLKNYFSRLYKLEPGPRSKHALNSEFVNAFGSIDKMNKSWLDFLQGHTSAQQ